MLPGVNLEVLSGELYIPKTSARASLVLMVTVGSASILLRRKPIDLVDFTPSSLKSTGAEEDEEDGDGY